MQISSENQRQIESAASESPLEFAVKQAADHAAFLYWGLTHPEFKTTAGKLGLILHRFALARGWEAPTLRMFEESLDAFDPLLSQQQQPPLGDQDQDALVTIHQLIALRQHIVQQQTEAKQFTGWLFPTFMTHTADEDAFNIAEAQGEFRDPVEIVRHHQQIIAEHLDFVAHLLNPASPYSVLDETSATVQRALIAGTLQEAYALYDLKSEVSDALQFQVLTDRVLSSIQKHQKAGSQILEQRFLSVIPEPLAVHVAREGNRAKVEIQHLQSSI